MLHNARIAAFSAEAAIAYALALTIAASEGYAARPMNTDDARIVDPRSCQLESWVKKPRESTEYWALPGCNFSGNLEVTFGGARTSSEDGMHTSDVVLQGKTLFKALEPGGWSFGLVAGGLRHPDRSRDEGLLSNPYGYVPATFSFLQDRVFVHLNLGLLHDKSASRTNTTWGIGMERQLTAPSWLIAEAYGDNRGTPFYQFGLRHWLVENRLQIDATFGNRFGQSTEERYFSIGLRVLSAPFLP